MLKVTLFQCLVLFIVVSGGIASKKREKGFPYISNDCQSTETLMVAHFIDGSGTNPAAINISMSFIYNLYYYSTYGLCSGYSRHIITAVADDLYPWPLNVTDSNMIMQIRDFFNSGLKPYKGIFDLQTAVTTFLNDPQYCSFDSRINAPAWAIIYAFSDTINGFNNFYNAAKKLHDVGFEVLLVAGNLKVYKMAQYMQVLPQENIVSASNVTGVDVAEYLLSRFNATYNVPIVNQTGLNGTILSPGYPNYYIPLTLVDYYIAAPTSYYQIFLVVNDFETYNCDDKLLIFKKEMMDDDDWLYTWCGNNYAKGWNFTIPASAVTFRFISYAGTSYKGFSISWNAIPTPPKS